MAAGCHGVAAPGSPSGLPLGVAAPGSPSGLPLGVAAKVDLQLPPRYGRRPQPSLCKGGRPGTAAGRREAHRRPGLGQQLLPMRLDRPLHRPQTGTSAGLWGPRGPTTMPFSAASSCRTTAAQGGGVAPVPAKPPARPVVQILQESPASRSLERLPATGLNVPLDRAPADPELPRDALRTPAQRMQPQQCRHRLRLDHHLPPRLSDPRRASAIRGSVLHVAGQRKRPSGIG